MYLKFTKFYFFALRIFVNFCSDAQSILLFCKPLILKESKICFSSIFQAVAVTVKEVLILPTLVLKNLTMGEGVSKIAYSHSFNLVLKNP